MRARARSTADSKAEVEHVRFGSWGEFMAQVRQPQSRDVAGHSETEGESNRRWTWTENYDEALHLAVAGWAEGFKRVTVKAEAIARATGKLTMDPRLAEAGDEVDVGMFLSGDPECMIEYPLEARRAPVVKIVVSVSFSSGVEAESIYNRGAAVVAAIDALEGDGVRVEVELDHSVGASGFTVRRRVVVKRGEEPLDRDKLAFALCHPSTLRRLFFRLYEQRGEDYWRKCGGMTYGAPVDPLEDEGAITVPSLTGRGFESMEEAARFAEGLLTEAARLQA